MRLFTRFLMICLSLTIILMCRECEPDPDDINYPSARRGIFICNEGNFMFGNASLSFYHPDSFTVHNQVFFNTNHFPPGDVLQSMTILDSLGFLVINNSGKILVINAVSFRHIATIGDFNSPRYIEIIDHHKAYVTDLYSKSITIINPVTFQKTGTVDVGRSTEKLVRAGDFVYVTGWSMNKRVYKIDSRSDRVTDSLTVPLQPNSIVLDKNGMLWVLSDGGYEGSPAGWEIPALSMIDPESFQVVREFLFPARHYSPDKLAINGRGDTLYYLSGGWASAAGSENGLFRMAVDAENLPDQPLIPQGRKLFYGLGIDPVNSDIYLSDAMDYLSRGWVFRYSVDGGPVDSFRVDIAPGAFCFFMSPP